MIGLNGKVVHAGDNDGNTNLIKQIRSIRLRCELLEVHKLRVTKTFPHHSLTCYPLLKLKFPGVQINPQPTPRP